MAPRGPGQPGAEPHRLFQLVLDLPVDLRHLEEDVACTQEAGERTGIRILSQRLRHPHVADKWGARPKGHLLAAAAMSAPGPPSTPRTAKLCGLGPSALLREEWTRGVHTRFSGHLEALPARCRGARARRTPRGCGGRRWCGRGRVHLIGRYLLRTLFGGRRCTCCGHGASGHPTPREASPCKPCPRVLPAPGCPPCSWPGS